MQYCPVPPERDDEVRVQRQQLFIFWLTEYAVFREFRMIASRVRFYDEPEGRVMSSKMPEAEIRMRAGLWIWRDRHTGAEYPSQLLCGGHRVSGLGAAYLAQKSISTDAAY